MDENSFLHNWDCRRVSLGQWDALGCYILDCPFCGQTVTYAANTIMYASICGGCGAMVGPDPKEPGHVVWYHADAAWVPLQQEFIKSHRYN